MKHWLMLQGHTALNTMYIKTHGKQTTYRSPTGTEKQIDCILIKRRHLKYSEHAEANDMIHMGSDHRCVMATFVINAQKRIALATTMGNIRARIGKEDGDKEVFTFEERYQEPEEEIKHEAAAAKSNLKQNKDGSTAETTEAEAEKEEGKESSTWEGESCSRDGYKRYRTARPPSGCKHRSSKREASDDKMQCTFLGKQNEMTRSNYNRIQTKTPNNTVMTEVRDSDDMTVTGEERPGHRV